VENRGIGVDRPGAATATSTILLFGLAALAACGSGQESGDRVEKGDRSPQHPVAGRPGMRAVAEERIRSAMPKSYECDRLDLERVVQVELTAADPASQGTERWCLHFEYACRTSPTGRWKEFASVVEVTYFGAADDVRTDLAMGPLFTWADPGFVGVNWMHCAAGTAAAPPS
jgi:hypothetical protein